MPNSISKGAVDIQVRVERKDFPKALKILSKHFRKSHPEIWADGFASFEKYDYVQIPVGIQLTIKNEAYDEFYLFRDYLIENPKALDEYNEFKKSFIGKTRQEYSKAKREHLGPNGK